jgi:transcriptional regulator with XRE-family HTH domain
MTRGRRALLRILERTRAYHVAARCRISEATVSRWRSGEKSPGPKARLALRDNYGIDPKEWDESPGA